MLALTGYAAKTQHPAKASTGCANPDMTAASGHYAVMLDGVSGAPPPMTPEGLARDMRRHEAAEKQAGAEDGCH
eukprot:6371704-Pyramimonas_sp.AAC.1